MHATRPVAGAIHLLTVAVVLGSLLGTAGAAYADKPARGCPTGDWQPLAFPLDWQPGEPLDPANGENVLVDITLAGFIEEFGSVDAALSEFGFSTFEEFYAAELDPVLNRFDRNDDGVLCFKPFPESGGQPDFLVNGVDNTANH